MFLEFYAFTKNTYLCLIYFVSQRILSCVLKVCILTVLK